jgi:hypothetical protein
MERLYRSLHVEMISTHHRERQLRILQPRLGCNIAVVQGDADASHVQLEVPAVTNLAFGV